MSPIGINEVRRLTVASGEPRHRAFNGTVRLTSGEILIFYREGSDHWRTDDGVVKMVRSSDDGESWSAPEIVFSSSDMSVGAHHGPEQLSDGRVILPMTLIKDISKRAFGGHYRSETHIISSDDGGRSWTEPTQIGPMDGWHWQNNYGRVRELPDGRVFVPGGGQKLGVEPWYSGYFVSHDGGRSFPGSGDRRAWPGGRDRSRASAEWEMDRHGARSEAAALPAPVVLRGRWPDMEQPGQFWCPGPLSQLPGAAVRHASAGAPAGRSVQDLWVCAVCVYGRRGELGARDRYIRSARRHGGLLIPQHGPAGRRAGVLFLLHRVCRRQL